MIKNWLIKFLGGYTEDDMEIERMVQKSWRDTCKRIVLGKDKAAAKKRRFTPVEGAPANTKLPTRGSKNAAGYDFYAPYEFVVPAHGTSDLIQFNVKAIMPTDEFLYLKIRSGLSVKHEVTLACSGVIDADFANNPDNDGNIGAKFRNYSNTDYIVKKGERCMQGIFLKYQVTCDDDADGIRGGGYGSTGKF